MRKTISLVIAIAFSCSIANAANNKWGLDPTHCKAIFVTMHNGALAPVTGWFDKIRGTIDYDGKNLAKAKVMAHIETDSIDSGSNFRDMHLRSEHFFDVKKFPDISFESKSVKPVSPGKFKMTGDLTIRNIKKSVVLDCTGPTGPVFDKDHKQSLIGVTAKTKINRKDFGMTWNREVDKGVFMVSDQAEITLEIEAIKIP